MDANLSKETPDSPLNIQHIITALSSKEEKKESSKFDISIYNIVIRKSQFAFDILSEKYDSTKFNKNHIRISNFTADIALPKLKNEFFDVHIKRLAFNERCGFTLNSLTGDFLITDSLISVNAVE